MAAIYEYDVLITITTSNIEVIIFITSKVSGEYSFLVIPNNNKLNIYVDITMLTTQWLKKTSSLTICLTLNKANLIANKILNLRAK